MDSELLLDLRNQITNWRWRSRPEYKTMSVIDFFPIICGIDGLKKNWVESHPLEVRRMQFLSLLRIAICAVSFVESLYGFL